MPEPVLPAVFSDKMCQILGDEYRDFTAACCDAPLRALRVNPLKRLKRSSGGQADPAACAASQIRACFPDASFKPVPWCPEGFYYEESETFRPGRSPYHAAGVYYIQEPSAMTAAVCLGARPGEMILDLCAAPGGKSTQTAAAMQGEGLLIANEIMPSRAKTLSENIERMGIRNAVVTNESPRRLADAWSTRFDRILVDAPCSGEGMFRKNPDAVSEWSPEAVSFCAQRQDEILACAAGMLVPGGTIVYSTCTFSPEENEGTLTRFLNTHPDFCIAAPPFSDVQRSAFGFSSGRPDLYPSAPEEIRHAIRIYPHRAKGEGHFIAVLKKSGERSVGSAAASAASQSCTRPAAGHKKSRKPGARTRAKGSRPASEKYTSAAALQDDLYDICPGFLSDTEPRPLPAPLPAERLTAFGDQFYLLPEQTPDLTGIRVLRPGLHLGTIKKSRFEPAHALALALSAEQAAHSFDLMPDQAAAWIAGQTVSVPPETPSGWALITAGGYSLGWGKCAGGVMKNHYPKGLRRA